MKMHKTENMCTCKAKQYHIEYENPKNSSQLYACKRKKNPWFHITQVSTDFKPIWQGA